jgi:signal transduction histidine kinase
MLAVENAGPPLPEEARAQLFDSMVTLRQPNSGSAPDDAAHLGLGLYIARLVAEFHGGTVRAANLPAGRGVRFEVELPWTT